MRPQGACDDSNNTNLAGVSSGAGFYAVQDSSNFRICVMIREWAFKWRLINNATLQCCMFVAENIFENDVSHISVFAFNLQGSTNFELLYNILDCDYFKVSCDAFLLSNILENEISPLEMKEKEIFEI